MEPELSPKLMCGWEKRPKRKRIGAPRGRLTRSSLNWQLMTSGAQKSAKNSRKLTKRERLRLRGCVYGAGG